MTKQKQSNKLIFVKIYLFIYKSQCLSPGCSWAKTYTWYKFLYHTANNFRFMYSQKRSSQASLLISTKYFQNRFIKFFLSVCLFCHSAVSIGTAYFQMELWNFNCIGDSHFQIKTIQMAPWIVISFSKIYIWYLGMRLSLFFLGSCNPNLN
jgi:hypothetical protein